MRSELKPNAVNQIPKGNLIFQEGEAVEQICLILKGHVSMMNAGIKTVLSSGSFIGSNDIFIGRYLVDYTAKDDVMLYVFPAEGPESLQEILSINKDYSGLMILYLSNYLREVYKGRENLANLAESCSDFIKKQYADYMEIGRKTSFSLKSMPVLEGLPAFENELETELRKINYYIDASGIPLDLQKSYYAAGGVSMACYQAEELSGLIKALILESREIADYLEEAVVALTGGEQSLFQNEVMLALHLKKNGQDAGQLTDMIDDMVGMINQAQTTLENRTNRTVMVDRARMEQLYYAVLSGSQIIPDKKAAKVKDVEKEVESLNDSLGQILRFANLKEERAAKFKADMELFLAEPDRLSTAAEVRSLKKEIASVFYELYEAVFFRAYGRDELPKAVELFLDFGYADERLLTKEQLYSLCKVEQGESSTPCEVHTLREWLTLIYENKKEPSKSELDVDYTDYVRELKKNGSITEQEEEAWLTDGVKKVHFEIEHMFKSNHKIVNGQISVFAPVLYKEAFPKNSDRAFLGKDTVNRVIERLLSVDYSIFYRESLYVNKDAGIEKEYIEQEVVPDIILLPGTGESGSMWQEITGKKRDTKGRFFLPVFMDTNLSDIMIKLFGRYRWELCRCIQGSAWNNIKYKSLTSEYMDYIQFYRKNSDLSAERKEKVKLQIQKGRNNIREIFVIDYEAWMKESGGMIKMNKVAREILATYCPFTKEIRTKLSTQPMFEEAMARFNREKAKKVQSLDLRYRALQRENIELTEELIETLRFYQEL
ncbi:MAG: Crp/Fnr family transcriptional regulator [Lachnospiraceae bacterium]|nr:Crp/Fnr family transcriptional regulator [Lachnospiraceae bacterium]